MQNNSTISSETVPLGGSITVNAKAEGGSGGYTYAILYKKTTDTKWVTKQNFSENEIVAVKPSNVAEYDLCVKVKDSNGDIVKKFFNFNTIAGVENTSTVNATAIKLGDTITMQGSATNGIAPYKYAF